MQEDGHKENFPVAFEILQRTRSHSYPARLFIGDDLPCRAGIWGEFGPGMVKRRDSPRCQSCQMLEQPASVSSVEVAGSSGLHRAGQGSIWGCRPVAPFPPQLTSPPSQGSHQPPSAGPVGGQGQCSPAPSPRGWLCTAFLFLGMHRIPSRRRATCSPLKEAARCTLKGGLRSACKFKPSHSVVTHRPKWGEIWAAAGGGGGAQESPPQSFSSGAVGD